MARLSPFGRFGVVLVFQAWLWPFWPGYGLSGLCLAFSDTLYNLTFPENSEIMKNFCRVCFSPKLTKHLSRLMTKKDSFQVELC